MICLNNIVRKFINIGGRMIINIGTIFSNIGRNIGSKSLIIAKYTLYNVYNLLNIFRLISHIGLFYIHKKYSGNYNTYILNNIIYNININGYIFIKFTQWMTSRLLILSNCEEERRVLKILENIYDNCHSHSILDTINIYKNDFNENIFKNYDIIEMVGSGSIGQVYKCRDLNTNELVAIKIKHTGIEYKYLISYSVIKLIIFIFWVFPNINYRILPINLSEFIFQLNNQLNFNNEVINCNRMYDLFKKNENVIIPKVIKHSNNIIVMTYEDGVGYEQLEINDIKKKKIALYFTLLIYKMSYSYGFIHGDLHKGNWKIKYSSDTGSFKIIYYDFGYVFCINKIRLNNDLIESIRYNLTGNITNIILQNSISKNNLDDKYDEINAMIMKYIPPAGAITTQKFTRMALLISQKYKLKYSTEMINILLILIQTEELCLSNNIKQDDDLSIEESKKFQYSLNEEYIILCKTYKYFDDLLIYFKDLNKKYNITGYACNNPFSNISYLENLG